MTDLIGQISTILTMTKALFEINKDFDEAIYKKQISDLAVEAAQAQTNAIEKETELRVLKIELEERKNNPLVYDGVVYRDNNQEAYCSGCYDNYGKRIHLDTNYRGVTFYRCPVCKYQFGIWSESNRDTTYSH